MWCKKRTVKYAFIEKSSIFTQSLRNSVKIRNSWLPYFDQVSSWLDKNCRFFNKSIFLIYCPFFCIAPYNRGSCNHIFLQLYLNVFFQYSRDIITFYIFYTELLLDYVNDNRTLFLGCIYLPWIYGRWYRIISYQIKRTQGFDTKSH